MCKKKKEESMCIYIYSSYVEIHNMNCNMKCWIVTNIQWIGCIFVFILSGNISDKRSGNHISTEVNKIRIIHFYN